jgi:hypothetical protein
MILSLIEGGGVPDVRCRRIGAPLPNFDTIVLKAVRFQ